MTFYDVNAAIDKPNIVNSLRQGFMFGQQKREIEQQEADRNELRALAAPAASGDIAAQDRALAIDPQRGQQYAQAGDRRINQLRGYIDYVERARATGNPQQLNAALAAGSGFIGQLTGKPGPTAWSDDPAFQQGWEALKAKVAMGGPEQQGQEPAGFRQAHLTAIAAGYQPGTPEYQQAMRVAAGTAPRSIPAGYTTRSYRDANGQEVVELVQIRGDGAGQQAPAMPGQMEAPMAAPAPTLAGQMPDMSDLVGNGVVLTSWRRTPEKNQEVGGQPNSRHLDGNGADFVVPQAQKAEWTRRAQAKGLQVIDEGDHMHVQVPRGTGGPGRGQTDADRARAAAEQAAAVEQAKIDAQLSRAPDQAAADAARAGAIKTAEAGAERTEAQRGMNRAYDLYRTASAGLEEALSGTTTNPAVGNLPAWTGPAQTAEGAIAAMAPVLKQLFRQAGEGVFTDKDQELLMRMLPTRQDHPEARRAKLANIDAIVQSKLGIGADQGQPPAQTPQQAPAQGGQYRPGQVIEVNGRRFRVIGGDPNDPDVEEV